MTSPLGLLVMAYGTASGPDDIERYYTDIRGGRSPDPEHLRELRERYEEIGNVFPLLETTRAQAEGTALRLRATVPEGVTPYLGMKHSSPFISEAVARMREDGIERAVGIVMAPHWSGMSVETYVERVRDALREGSGGPDVRFVRSYHDHPAYVSMLAGRVREALETIPEGDRRDAAIVFTAHSLPTRTEADGTLRCKTCGCEESCAYRDGLQRTADLVADAVGAGHALIAWQSAGRTGDPWWGPPLDEVLVRVAAQGVPAVVVCSAGFVADHLETLYDLDVEARAVADEAGIAFARTRMPNADPEFLDVLARVVEDHLANEVAGVEVGAETGRERG